MPYVGTGYILELFLHFFGNFSPNLNRGDEKRRVIRKSSTSKRRSLNFLSVTAGRQTKGNNNANVVLLSSHEQYTKPLYSAILGM